MCNQVKSLCTSHVIPKFAGKYIKNTSATGFLRLIENPNLRQQDIIKVPLLCDTCEQIFSKFETYFAKNIFYPYNNLKLKLNFEVIYDENLIKYIISQSWRILYLEYNNYLKGTLSTEVDTEILSVLKYWQSYLLSKSSWNEKKGHYLFFWDYAPLAGQQLPKKFEFYITRAADGTIASNDEKSIIIVFTQIPSISIISTIRPSHLSGWVDAEIYDEGVIKVPQQIEDFEIDFFGFVKNRIKKIEQFNMSKKQQQKVLSKILKNSEKFEKSKTYEAFFEKFLRERL